jgi:hypothetical protein
MTCRFPLPSMRAFGPPPATPAAGADSQGRRSSPLHRAAVSACALLALLLAAGCAQPVDLRNYTLAGYPPPAGFVFPQPGDDAPAGLRSNPGSIDPASVMPIYPGSRVNATEGAAAYVVAADDPGVGVVSVAVRLERALSDDEVDLYRSLCSDDEDAAHLIDDETLAVVTWHGDARANEAAETFIGAVAARTGAQRIC